MSVEHLRTLTARQVAAELSGDEEGAWDTGAVRYGLDTFRIVYRTVDPDGRVTIASGLLALPRNGERRLRSVSFTHGTELFKSDVASVSADVWGQAAALTTLRPASPRCSPTTSVWAWVPAPTLARRAVVSCSRLDSPQQ
ncbi:hypothetical protein ABTY98_22625 [Streptomyces sp. NPDC096040]|uniref:hypothetical protein n=1 Tax=Streptomyces sp. NPDC096040 TaxID=3155541 RepID=UPI00331C5C1C